MTTVINGLLGGLVGGFVAGVVTMNLTSGPSVAAVVARMVGNDSTSRWRNVAIHSLYGGVAGGAPDARTVRPAGARRPTDYW